LRDSLELARSTFDPLVTLELDAPSVPLWIRGDAVELQQMIVHPLLHASEAVRARLDEAPDGYAPAIHVSIALESASEVCISVADNGAPLDRAAAIRDPETLANAISADAIPLGLMTVQRLAQSYGGRMQIESQPGGGTTFSLRLVLEQRSDVA
jgi:signal transduction histidine kinase